MDNVILPSRDSVEAGAPEFKITPEMVEAGELEFVAWHEREDFSTEDLVKSIYLAMRNAEKIA